MDLPWWPPEAHDSGDGQPPWVKYSRSRTQQELCARRFLRFATLRHVHGAIAVWAAALWFAGAHPLLASAPIVYFTGTAAVVEGLQQRDVDRLSQIILGLDAANALHLAALCASCRSGRAAASPAFVFVPLTRALFGFFAHDTLCHLAFSTCLGAWIVCCGGSHVMDNEALLVVVAATLLELTAVVVLAEGPCGYEEALMHLSQCRAQHQLMRAEAVQRIDIERERFSGQLLAIASESISELTASVQRASEPVVSMLQSACATGTKSAREADRIGRIGEALKEEVDELLAYRTQVAWSRLSGHAKARSEWLHDYAAEQQAHTESMLHAIRQRLGATLAQMHELELEAEPSLQMAIQSEINRAMETADARMDLVRESANAMKRRVSDTVEVLLSLLKYFRSKGDPLMAKPLPAPQAQEGGARGRSRERRAARELGASAADHAREAKALPAIEERPAEFPEACVDTPPTPSSLADVGSEGHRSLDRASGTRPGSSSASVSCCSTGSCSGSGAAAEAAEFVAVEADGGSCGSTTCEEPAAAPGGGPAAAATGAELDGCRAAGAAQAEAAGCHSGSGGGGVPGARGPGSASTERHPLFATRLCYQSEHFFWSWASSRDFRGEIDALRAWQRASTERPSAAQACPQEAAAGECDLPRPGTRESVATAAGEGAPPAAAAAPPAAAREDADAQGAPAPPSRPAPQAAAALPTRVVVDLSGVRLPPYGGPGGPTGGRDASG